MAVVPHGWHVGGSKPDDYLSGVDENAIFHGHPSAYLKTDHDVADEYGLLVQEFAAQAYAGKRVRLSAFVKTQNVRDWAGLWLRFQEGPEPGVAVAKRQEHLVSGTASWHSYEVLVDVPKDATSLGIGVMLHGPGTVWINSVSFKIVGTDDTKAGIPPSNLNFEE
jgi:hypothetical protein